MGNCLKFCSSTPEDDTLLPEQEQETSTSDQASPIEVRTAVEGESEEPIFFVSPNVGTPASQLTEDEQIKIAQRIGFIQQMSTGVYDGTSKNKECAICMGDFALGDSVRYLPCMHVYHAACIDDWLMRSFTCPWCMEPVDAALLSTFHPR